MSGINIKNSVFIKKILFAAAFLLTILLAACEEDHTHTPGPAATCTSPQICTNCNAELSSALGHKFSSTILTLPKSDTVHGTERLDCTVCNYYNIIDLPPTYHLEYYLYNENNAGNKYSVAIGSAKDDRIIIPETYDGYPITAIRNEGFKGRFSLSSIYFPDTSKNTDNPAGYFLSIGDGAFYGCVELKSIILPKTVNYIGKEAFLGCSNILEMEIPNDVKIFDDRVFYTCTKLAKINIPTGVTKIGSETFYHCNKLTEIDIPESVTSIGREAFSYCKSLTSIIIPNSVTYIGAGAFSYCDNLANAVISDNEKFTIIPAAMFKECPLLKDISIPENIKKIDNYAFEYCKSLESIIIPNSITHIGASAFYGCTSLTEVTIGSGIQVIGASAFSGCVSLVSLTVLSENPNITWHDVNILDDTHKDLKIYVLDDKVDMYKNAGYWSDFSDRIMPISQKEAEEED